MSARKPKVEDTKPIADPSGAALPAAATDAAAPRPWVLYLLECAGERLYAGITNDLAARFLAHVEGRGARFTRAFPPVRIVAASTLPSRSAALKAEYALKQQARATKLRFLAGCGVPLDLGEARGSQAGQARAPSQDVNDETITGGQAGFAMRS